MMIYLNIISSTITHPGVVVGESQYPANPCFSHRLFTAACGGSGPQDQRYTCVYACVHMLTYSSSGLIVWM